MVVAVFGSNSYNINSKKDCGDFMKNCEIFSLSDISVEEIQFSFAVILTKYKQFWVLCKHKERSTWEIPGGKCEPGEFYELTAHRELFEETGAVDYQMQQEFAFLSNGTYGIVYFADIFEFQSIGESEMERIDFFDDLSTIDWTYPDIQPFLIEHFNKYHI